MEPTFYRRNLPWLPHCLPPPVLSGPSKEAGSPRAGWAPLPHPLFSAKGERLEVAVDRAVSSLSLPSKTKSLPTWPANLPHLPGRAFSPAAPYRSSESEVLISSGTSGLENLIELWVFLGTRHPAHNFQGVLGPGSLCEGLPLTPPHRAHTPPGAGRPDVSTHPTLWFPQKMSMHTVGGRRVGCREIPQVEGQVSLKPQTFPSTLRVYLSF